VVYQASSPDEKALVEAATQFGFVFKKREYEDMELEVFGTQFKFQVLNTLEFSSDRRRMSVIVKSNFGDHERIFLLSKGTAKKIILFDVLTRVKGADTVMIERAAAEQAFIEPSAIDDQTRQFAYQGLRTIVLAFKELDPTDYTNWYEISFKPSVENLANRQQLIDEAAGSSPFQSYIFIDF